MIGAIAAATLLLTIGFPPHPHSAVTTCNGVVHEDGSCDFRPNPGWEAKVIDVHDGDTFTVQVLTWPGIEMTTKIRLAGIDAPELHGRCESETQGAIAARSALRQLLGNTVFLQHLKQDKYGRWLAYVTNRDGKDVAHELLDRKLVRPYDGGARGGWCDAEDPVR